MIRGPLLMKKTKMSAVTKKLNILMLYADDWRFDSVGYLNPEVHTPVLDKLTTEGMVFTENAVTTSICWISRACLATGQHYARHQTIDLSSPVPFHKYWDETLFAKLDPVPFHNHWNETLFAKLKDNGYVTGMVGKWQPGIVKEHMFSHINSYSGFHYSANSYYGFHYSGEEGRITSLI
uniref:Sulfatase N-terminal domain-containing protein n=1 Tax=Ditylum brightwellii TaxID=49249 RepID=A0A7S4SAM3_9STRA